MLKGEVRRSLPLALAVALLAACGDSTGPDSGVTSLSDSESNALALDFLAAAVNAMNSASGSPGLTASVPVNVQYSHVMACPAGGHISVSGSLTGSVDDQGSGALFLQILETPTDCAHEFQGSTVAFSGNPYISVAGTFTYLNGAAATQQSLNIGGGFSWSADPGGSGSCTVILSLNLATNASGTTTLSGTVCGRQVNYSSQ